MKRAGIAPALFFNHIETNYPQLASTCHSREGGNPGIISGCPFPAFARTSFTGMTFLIDTP
jgi:hypothetical protein